MLLKLVIILVVNFCLIDGQSNPDLRTYSTNYKSHHTYQRLPQCAIREETNARICARDKSGVTVADQNNRRRVCCYEWILIDCWEKFNRRMCVQPAHYQDWLAFKRYSIESVERGECREHRYHHNIENCARWQPYSPYKQAEADTGSFTDNRNDNNYNDKNASYFPMPNVFLIFVIVSLKMLY